MTTGAVAVLIFDLSEVLISGLYGVERELARALSTSEEHILACLGGEPFEQLLTGRMTEVDYLAGILARERWTLDVAAFQAAIRRNLDHEVPGMAALVAQLAARYELVLLSDHAREWVAYARSAHPIFGLFRHAFFSYELGTLKHDPATFVQVLRLLGRSPEECLFIDDNPANIQAAAAAGIAGIQFGDAVQLARELHVRGLLDEPIYGEE